jgi:hypothetical protein
MTVAIVGRIVTGVSVHIHRMGNGVCQVISADERQRRIEANTADGSHYTVSKVGPYPPYVATYHGYFPEGNVAHNVGSDAAKDAARADVIDAALDAIEDGSPLVTEWPQQIVD